MDEQTVKTISLPDMAVAFASMSSLFGNHAAIANCTNFVDEEYTKQFESYESSEYIEELKELIVPIFTYLYLKLLLEEKYAGAKELFRLFSSDVLSRDQNLKQSLSDLKSSSQIKNSNSAMHLYCNKVSCTLSDPSKQILLHILEKNKLWLIYAVLCEHFFIKLHTQHEFASTNTGDDSNDTKEANSIDSILPASLQNDFEIAKKAISSIPFVIPPVRLITCACRSMSNAVSCRLFKSGSHAAIANSSGTISIVRVINGRDDFSTEITVQALSKPVTNLELACEDQLLIATSGSNIFYWKLGSLDYSPSNISQLPSLNSFQPLWTLSVSALDVFLASGCNDSSANLYDISRLDNSSCLVRVFVDISPSAKASPVSATAFHPNCSYLASGHCNGSVVMWDVNDAAPVRTFSTSSFPIADLKFSPNGINFFTADDSGLVSTWDLRGNSTTPISRFSTEITRPTPSLSISPDSSLLCIGGMNRFRLFPSNMANVDDANNMWKPNVLPGLQVFDADFRLGNILHVLAFKTPH